MDPVLLSGIGSWKVSWCFEASGAASLKSEPEDIPFSKPYNAQYRVGPKLLHSQTTSVLILSDHREESSKFDAPHQLTVCLAAAVLLRTSSRHSWLSASRNGANVRGDICRSGHMRRENNLDCIDAIWEESGNLRGNFPLFSDFLALFLAPSRARDCRHATTTHSQNVSGIFMPRIKPPK